MTSIFAHRARRTDDRKEIKTLYPSGLIILPSSCGLFRNAVADRCRMSLDQSTWPFLAPGPSPDREELLAFWRHTLLLIILLHLFRVILLSHCLLLNTQINYKKVNISLRFLSFSGPAACHSMLTCRCSNQNRLAECQSFLTDLIIRQLLCFSILNKVELVSPTVGAPISNISVCQSINAEEEEKVLG